MLNKSIFAHKHRISQRFSPHFRLFLNRNNCKWIPKKKIKPMTKILIYQQKLLSLQTIVNVHDLK